jgi:hypothetical protein
VEEREKESAREVDYNGKSRRSPLPARLPLVILRHDSTNETLLQPIQNRFQIPSDLTQQPEKAFDKKIICEEKRRFEVSYNSRYSILPLNFLTREPPHFFVSKFPPVDGGNLEKVLDILVEHPQLVKNLNELAEHDLQ